jgi:hypothetical protein
MMQTPGSEMFADWAQRRLLGIDRLRRLLRYGKVCRLRSPLTAERRVQSVRRHHDNHRVHLNPAPLSHRVIAANVHAVPTPFLCFAVRSDEPLHACDARAPYGWVHLLRMACLDSGSLASLAGAGDLRCRTETFSDIEYAATSLPELAVVASRVADLGGQIAGALQLTGVLGSDPADYRHSVGTRIDYLAARGAGFHNDVSRHWSRCLFWLLALDLDEVDFVMPHAGVCVALAPGDLLVFDPTMAHGLCRPGDAGQAVATSFGFGTPGRQIFLTGELLLSDAQWAALGAPWLPVEVHEQRAALDLMVAEFDDRSGAIKRVRALGDCMKRSTCHVDGPVD